MNYNKLMELSYTKISGTNCPKVDKAIFYLKIRTKDIRKRKENDTGRRKETSCLVLPLG